MVQMLAVTEYSTGLTLASTETSLKTDIIQTPPSLGYSTHPLGLTLAPLVSSTSRSTGTGISTSTLLALVLYWH